jgi:hypothetical protein
LSANTAAAASPKADTAEADAAVYVRAQDRDELARSFTVYNAVQNGVPPSVLSAHTEPLLACPATPPEGSGPATSLHWDLILSNIPAKTGGPVLLDFISRSAVQLTPGGLTALVVVNPLANLLRTQIGELDLPLIHDETGAGHTVLVYGPPGAGPEALGTGSSGETAAADAAKPEATETGTAGLGAGFLRQWPAYFRGAGDYEMEGIPYHIDAFHGVADFDSPGGAVQATAKLVSRLDLRLPLGALLFHEPDQGRFPVWLLRYWGLPEGPLEAVSSGSALAMDGPLVLSGRNILALEAARHNILLALGNTTAGIGERDTLSTGAPEIVLVPAVDLSMDRERLSEAAQGRFGFIAAFPELVPQTDRLDAYWEGLAALLVPGGMAVIGLPSSEAERFDRKKPKGFTRLGDIKRHGFRALGYRYSG